MHIPIRFIMYNYQICNKLKNFKFVKCKILKNSENPLFTNKELLSVFYKENVFMSFNRILYNLTISE